MVTLPNGGEGFSLFRYSTGRIIIREPKTAGVDDMRGQPWLATDTHTHSEVEARKILAKLIAKKKLTLDPAKVPLIESPRRAQERETHNARKRERRADKRSAPTRKPDPGNVLERARALVQIIATAHASAATALRLLQELVGEPTFE